MPNRLPVCLSRKITLAICVLLLAFFAATSWFAVSSKSPTYDEVYHAPSAWLNLHWADYRVDFENPPLWKYWASLPNGKSALHANFNSPTWKDIPQHIYLEWWWCVRTLFKTPGNDGERFIQNCRAMMLMVGVGLGVLIAWWAWRVSGGVAAVVATGLFSFDPNFLGHSPLMKNDVAFTFCLLALMYGVWRIGQRLSWQWMIGVALLCGLMANVKLTGVVMAGVLVPLMLVIRLVMPREWWMLGKERCGVWERGKYLLAMIAVCVAVTYAMIWADYRFRFRPTVDPRIQLNMQGLVDKAKENELLARSMVVTPRSVAQIKTSPGVEAVLFANRHHLLPQAWLGGLLFQYATTRVRSAFLLGENGYGGWWYYFPLAMLVKTPVATLLGGVLAIFVALKVFLRRKHSGGGEGKRDGWTALCLIIPIAVYMASAMMSHLNIGVRHVLAVYPFAFILIGCAAEIAWRRWHDAARLVIVAGGLMLAMESLLVYPNYIAFFNFAAGGSRNGIHLLADSNLDWGQDLKLLASWQRKNPDPILYLSYFGLADPAFYGIRYVPLRGGYPYDKDPKFPTLPGVVAVSASNLQGLFSDSQAVGFYQMLGGIRPMEVLGGTIYLYRWPPAAGDLNSAGAESRN